MQQISDAHYQQGRQAFNRGASLRDLVQQFVDSRGQETDEGEAELMSFGLGFIDAAFDRLRGIDRSIDAVNVARGD